MGKSDYVVFGNPYRAFETVNGPVQDINIGILRLAKETGCEIVPTILHYDEFQKKRCYASRGVPFRLTSSDDVFTKKDELIVIMQDIYFALMEKYSSYESAALEAEGVSLRTQWEAPEENLCGVCDIPGIGYRLGLSDEKRIGKTKVANPVVTPSKAFVHLNKMIPCRENAFLFGKKRGLDNET